MFFISLPACRLSLWMGITWAPCLMRWGIWRSSAVLGSPSTRSLTSPLCWRGSVLWTGCSWLGTESKPWNSADCWGWVTSRTSTYGEPRVHQGALFKPPQTSAHEGLLIGSVTKLVSGSGSGFGCLQKTKRGEQRHVGRDRHSSALLSLILYFDCLYCHGFEIYSNVSDSFFKKWRNVLYKVKVLAPR